MFNVYNETDSSKNILNHYGWSRTPLPSLNLCGINLEGSNSLMLLGVTLDDKFALEKYIGNIVFSIAQKMVYSQILQKS